MLSGPYRAGPWPGLTPRGAAVLLICAVVLALLVERVNAFAGVIPLAMATYIVRVPGCASAVTATYLLPRALWSLIDPTVPLPPLLLVPAMGFDLAVWLRRSDLRVAWPFRKRRWPAKRDRSPRRLTGWRIAAGTLVFVLVLAINQAFFSF